MKALTVLSPRLRTRHVRYAVFPIRAVTLAFCEKSKVGSGFDFGPEEWSSICCRGLVCIACLSMLSIVRSPRLSVSVTREKFTDWVFRSHSVRRMINVILRSATKQKYKFYLFVPTRLGTVCLMKSRVIASRRRFYLSILFSLKWQDIHLMDISDYFWELQFILEHELC